MCEPSDLTCLKQQQQQSDVEGGCQHGECQLSTILPPFSAPCEEPHFKKLMQAGGGDTHHHHLQHRALLLLKGRAMTDRTSRTLVPPHLSGCWTEQHGCEGVTRGLFPTLSPGVSCGALSCPPHSCLCVSDSYIHVLVSVWLITSITCGWNSMAL